METLNKQVTENRNVQPQEPQKHRHEPVKETYQAPVIEAMEVKVEKGYASSGLDDRNNRPF